MKSKIQRREEAEVRQTEASKLTKSQRIDKLDRLFGKNKGALKERTKLNS